MRVPAGRPPAVMQAIVESDEHGFEFEVEMLLVAIRQGMASPGFQFAPFMPEKPAIFAGQAHVNFMRMVSARASGSRIGVRTFGGGGAK